MDLDTVVTHLVTSFSRLETLDLLPQPADLLRCKEHGGRRFAQPRPGIKSHDPARQDDGELLQQSPDSPIAYPVLMPVDGIAENVDGWGQLR